MTKKDLSNKSRKTKWQSSWVSLTYISTMAEEQKAERLTPWAR